jgi:hypothetical protein
MTGGTFSRTWAFGIRLLLFCAVCIDCVFFGMVATHFVHGGIGGVRAWILHVSLVSGSSFDNPITQEFVQRSLTNFWMIVTALVTFTGALIAGDVMLRRRNRRATER